MLFEVDHNLNHTRGFADMASPLEPVPNSRTQFPRCPSCGSAYGDLWNNFYDRDMVVEVGTSKRSTKWPDIAPCYPSFLLVTQRVLEAWEVEGIGTFPCFPVRVPPPFPNTLTPEPPMYYRLDYKKMVGVKIDFEASGYVNARTCDCCGRFLYDDTRTDIKHWTKICPMVFKSGTWNESHVFYSDHTRFMFCTEKVVDCAYKHKLTNFRFVPIEIANSATWFKGMDYSRKNWREKLPEQIRQFEEEFYIRAEVYKRTIADGEGKTESE